MKVGWQMYTLFETNQFIRNSVLGLLKIKKVLELQQKLAFCRWKTTFFTILGYTIDLYRSSCLLFSQKVLSEAATRDVLLKKVFLKISQNSQKNTCTRVSFLIKVASLRPATSLKKWLWHRCFSVNFAKFLSTFFW